MGTKVHTSKPLKERKEKKPKRERPPKTPPAPAFFTGTATPTHAKWPSMFKRHLGVIETHIRTLDRVMQSMKAHMDQMPVEERSAWESGEVGKWGVICGMMSRTRMVLKDAREAGRGILPDHNLKEKKSLGAMGAVADAYEATRATRSTNPKPAAQASNSIDSESESGSDPDCSSGSSSSSSEDESDIEQEKSQTPPRETPVFVPITLSKKRKLSDVDTPIANEKNAEASAPNPYFVVDTEPTPVVLNGAAPSKKSKKKHASESSGTEKKSKRRSVDAEGDVRKKSKKDKPVSSEAEVKSAEVDFAAIEKQLQAEVDAGMKAAEEAKFEKKEKKRKRVSDGVTSSEVVVKKVKKDKAEKRKVDGETSVEDSSKKQRRKHKVRE